MMRTDGASTLLTQNDDDTIEKIAQRVAKAQTQEDLFGLLGQLARHFDQGDGIIHDENFMGGAEGLLSSLHNAILLRDGSKRKYYRISLSHGRALQCTVLITSVEMMLPCSSEILADNIDILRKDLVPSMPKLLNLFVAWEGGETELIRLLTISTLIKLIKRCGPLCPEATDSFIESLLNVLRGHIASPAIHVEGASAIAHLFDCQRGNALRKRVINHIQNDSSLILSALSTAALAATQTGGDEILTGLFNFAVNSHVFRTKMAKRRCTILAIGMHLTNDQVENRKVALNICKCLLNDNLQTATEPGRKLDGNQDLLIRKVIRSALCEQEPTLQLYAISLLGDAVQNANLMPAMVDTIMQTLKELVDRDGHDEIVIEASVTYTKAAVALHPTELSKELLINVADFTTMPFARTRTKALAAIDFFISNDELISVLLFETEMLENISLIVSYGSNADGVDAINICRLLARNPAHHSALCHSSSFLHALVKLVTQEEVIERTCYAGGVETVLALLSSADNVRSFLPFPDLLPVLVSLANTVSDEESKKKLVSAIVRLSSAILG